MFALTTSIAIARPARRARARARAPRAPRADAMRDAPTRCAATRVAPTTTRDVRHVAQIAGKSTPPPPPPARVITAAQYVTAFSAVMGVYALQMLLVPAKMVTDHFNASADQMTQFWIRGSAVGFGGLVCAVRALDIATGAKIALFASFACGALYPWNAKFNWAKHNLSLKYPMHYVPEVLMALLTLAGAYVVYL